MMKFEDGKTYVFSREKFFKSKEGNKEYYESDPVVKSWIDKCDGQRVTILSIFLGEVNGYYIIPNWCKKIRK